MSHINAHTDAAENSQTNRRARERVVVLNDPNAMRINKELAEEIGFQDSIVFLQIEYLISISRHEIDERRWTRQSLEELHEKHFPWWSTMTIKRILARLVERQLLIVDTFNKVGYDRTQWYAIDPEGVSNLHSIAIYQNDKSIYQNEPIEENKMINGRDQFDTTIPETTKEEFIEKGTNVPMEKPKKLKVSDSEAESRWEALLEADPNTDTLSDFAAFRASRNQNGEIKLATLWRQIGEPYSKSKAPPDALRHGLEVAISREVADIRYALAVAGNYNPNGHGAGSGAHGSRDPGSSIAVIGAKESDYDPEEYRLHE